MLATFAGGIVAAFFLILILIGIFSAIAASGDQETKIEENTLLVLNLEGPILDRYVENPFEDVIAEMSGKPGTEGLNRKYCWYCAGGRYVISGLCYH